MLSLILCSDAFLCPRIAQDQPPLSLKWPPLIVTNQYKITSKMCIQIFYTTSPVYHSHHSSKPGHVPACPNGTYCKQIHNIQSSLCLQYIIQLLVEFAVFLVVRSILTLYMQTDIAKLEIVQQKAACFVLNDFLSYYIHAAQPMLSRLNWQSLEECNYHVVYKVINNLICIDLSQDLHPSFSSNRRCRRFISLPAIESTHIVILFFQTQFENGTLCLQT